LFPVRMQIDGLEGTLKLKQTRKYPSFEEGLPPRAARRPSGS
jgi:hypothetical protein